MQKITPYLWFDNNLEEAITFYTSLFPQSKIDNISCMPDGSVFSGTFHLLGQEFYALNGGPQYKFTEAISLFITCETQDEVDYYWNNLIANGGAESRCGWLKDKFGLSWQVVPTALEKYLRDPNREKAQYAMQAMLKMNKIIIAELERSSQG